MIEVIELKNKYIKVRTKEECKDLFEYAKQQNYEMGDIDNITFYPIVFHFLDDYTVIYSSKLDYFKQASNWNNIKDRISTGEITAREFLEKFLNYINCSGRNCESCKFYEGNNKTLKKLCNLSNWRKDDIPYIIELVKKDDPIYHPHMDDLTSAYFLEDILGKTELNEDEEKALKYAIKKLKESNHEENN